MNTAVRLRSFLQPHLPFLVLLAVLGGLYASSLALHGMFMWDEGEYACLARALARGEPYTDALRPPLLPASGSLVLRLDPRAGDAALKIPLVLFALLCLTAVYAFMSESYDRLTGLMAAGLLGVAPTFWEHITYFLTEIPLILFFTCALFWLYRGLSGSAPRALYLAWACLGMGLLTRYTALLLGPLFGVFALLALLRRQGRAALRSRHFWLSPLAGLLVVAPWLIRAQLVHGDALVGLKIASGQMQSYMPGLSFPWYAYLLAMPQLVGWPGVVLALLGAGWAVFKRDRLALHLLLVGVLILAWFSCYRYKELRLVTSVLPFVACLGALGLTRALPGRLFARLESVACVLIALIVLVWVQLRPALEASKGLGYPSFLEATDWLRQNTPTGAVIMGAPTPQLSWYLDRPVVSVPGQEAELREALGKVDRVVLVNWERGQPAYATSLFDRAPLTAAEMQSVQVFHDSTFINVVLEPEVLLRRLPAPTR